MIAHADAVVGVTPPIADDLRERVNPRAVTITNGYDPDDLAQAEAVAATAPTAVDRFTLAYTGTLAYGGVSPAPLLEGFRQLRRQDPQAAARLQLVFAGPMSGADLAELEAPDLATTVRTLGPISRESALGLQRAAHALVLLIDGRRPSIATGKLYEYLSTGRPILVIGAGSVAARIVEESRAGLVSQADDPLAIAGALQRLLDDREIATTVDPATLERFSYQRLAVDMAEQVEQAIARRSRRR